MQIDTKISTLFISISIVLVMILIYDKNAKVLTELQNLQATIQPIANDYNKQKIIHEHELSQTKDKETSNKADELTTIKAQMQQQFADFQNKQALLEAQLIKAQTVKPQPLPPVETELVPLTESQEAQLKRTNSKLKILNNATLMAVVTYVNMDWNLVNLELKKPEYVREGDILTIRRKGNVLGKITVSTVDGARASADVDPKTIKGSINIGDELIFY